MIVRLSGILQSVAESGAIVEVGDLDYQVLIADFSRRQLQSSIGERVSFFTLHFHEGNPNQGRTMPRLVGFLSEVEREFFEMFCSVEGVGIRKALKAMVRPVQDVAVMIAERDVKGLVTLPGIGPAMADRIGAKLWRKMSKFALIVGREIPEGSATQLDVIQDCYDTLHKLGHSESDSRLLVDKALEEQKQFKDVNDLLQAVYRVSRNTE